LGPNPVTSTIADDTPGPLSIEVSAHHKCNEAEIRDADQAVNNGCPYHYPFPGLTVFETTTDQIRGHHQSGENGNRDADENIHNQPHSSSSNF
jgi:hypothetical protein